MRISRIRLSDWFHHEAHGNASFAPQYSSLGNVRSTAVFAGSLPITRPRLLRQHPEVRALPSTGITRLQRYYGPLRRPDGPPASLPAWETRSLRPGPPPITQTALRTCRSHYPGEPNRCACRLLPGPCCLPRYSGGSASTTSLSRPAQDSLALRPARLLPRLAARFVTRLRHDRSPFHIARQLPVLPTTDGMGSSPIGGLRRWGALNNPG